ncbi:MAG: PilZ domain-containing protein [Nitrospira sp.]
MSIARLTDVDISAGGLGFDTPREFQAEDLLMVKVILPPFSMIETMAKIIRVTPLEQGKSGFHLATQFVRPRWGRAGTDYPAYSPGSSRAATNKKSRASSSLNCEWV